MLTKLAIHNYALIDRLDMDLNPGLSIITGETGAGKSIILGALSLLMGGRADSKVVGQEDGKTIVEAVFQIDSPAIRSLFEEKDWDWEGQIIIRRQVSNKGKSRAFVNDVPVTLADLQQLTPLLIDIHSQHQTLLLSENSYQLQIIDAFSDNQSVRDEYAEAFRGYVALRQKLQRLKNNEAQLSETSQLIDFQLADLDKLQPRYGEQAELEKEFDLLNDTEEIKDALGAAYNLLDAGDDSVLEKIASASSHLAQIDMSLLEDGDEPGSISHRLSQCAVELKDIAQSLMCLDSKVVSDRVRLEQVEKRMNDLYVARKHYKVASVDELVDLHNAIKKKKETLSFSPEEIERTETEMRRAATKLKECAERLSRSREEGASKFSELLTETARPLGLGNLRFEVALKKSKMSLAGQDHIEFLSSFNKNSELQPMSKIASGGEASRLMLSVKSLMATKMNLPTIIFDEVDTGVSGEIADCMGEMMRGMARQIQVLAITHLPQVASKGEHHFHVYKQDDDVRTRTHISLLTQSERIDEIARMLSGSSIGEEARKNACVLLNNK